MTTDCPNCSSLLEGEIAPGARVVCPFCGETFEVCTSPFEQLRMFMETHWPPPEHGGPFCEGEAPRKNYTGWIIHRLREDNPEAVIDLMSAISPGCRTDLSSVRSSDSDHAPAAAGLICRRSGFEKTGFKQCRSGS